MQKCSKQKVKKNEVASIMTGLTMYVVGSISEIVKVKETLKRHNDLGGRYHHKVTVPTSAVIVGGYYRKLSHFEILEGKDCK